jgi:hypothetical protein
MNINSHLDILKEYWVTFMGGFMEVMPLSLYALTPKGLNVRTVDKPVLVSVTWAHTIFGFFETFCERVSHSKLRERKKS